MKKIFVALSVLSITMQAVNAQTGGNSTTEGKVTKTQYVSTSPGKASPNIKAAPAKSQPKGTPIKVPMAKQAGGK